MLSLIKWTVGMLVIVSVSGFYIMTCPKKTICNFPQSKRIFLQYKFKHQHQHVHRVNKISDCEQHNLYRKTLAACPYCDLVMKRHNMKVFEYSVCPRCHSRVEHEKDCCPQFLKWTIIAALFFYIPANFYPLVAVEIAGSVQDTSVFNGVVFLIQQDRFIPAAIILFCGLIVPTLILLIFTILLVARNYHVWYGFQAYCVRLLVQLRHWSMLDIYLISFLVTMFKVKEMGEIQMQIGIFAFIGLTLSVNKLFISYDKPALWRLIGQSKPSTEFACLPDKAENR